MGKQGLIDDFFVMKFEVGVLNLFKKLNEFCE